MGVEVTKRKLKPEYSTAIRCSRTHKGRGTKMIEETIMVKEPEQEQDTSKSSAQKQTETKDKPMEPVAEKLRRFLIRNPKALVVGWSIVALAFLISIPAAYLCWYFLPPHLWKWANEVWWHWIPAFFG